MQSLGKDFSVVNARFVKPLDMQFLSEFDGENLITIEDNVFLGGLGSMIDGTMVSLGKSCNLKNFAYRDEFIYQGKVGDLQCKFGVDCKEIEAYISGILL